MDAYEAIVTKRDTRAFAEEPIDDDVLRRILQAGRMAGSAKNTQPCRFVVLTERSRKQELAACGQFADFIPTAAVNIAVVLPSEGRPFDAGRAAQNMLVAANAHGLASCPVSMHDQDCAAKTLGLPEGHQVAIVLAIGPRPSSGEQRLGATRLPMDDYVHSDRWSS